MTDVTICMCYDGVRGESRRVPDAVKKSPASGGWMDLKSCSFAAGSNFGQRSSEQIQGAGDVTDVTITKLTDASSTGLFREALLGEFDKNVVITFMRTGRAGPQEYLRLELQQCGISSFGSQSVGNDRPVESFSIRYGRMVITSFAFDKGGQATAQGTATIDNPD
jgi:type VI secretion system secreted protein Hcp